MDFSQIINMKSVIDLISQNEFYSKLKFYVYVYSDDKSRSAGKNAKVQLSFGNLNAQTIIDHVNIEVYSDIVVLHHAAEGSKKHKATVDQRRGLSLENKIIAAFDSWRSYYRN